ncbi:hypothetical protein [Gloeobacter kilaueensis]|uniref:AMIN domain-containing protein n=1 Tax=Gloeobacter kilaueensis (strain ATCC BAA-2537 / CCAP 1431/1 / ULC 316 / JS1) TaxID=1183438 RepID=U5QIS3_GLOK1|nr:hypothetical protein [Gloeobacter kilaueensis]AGY58862.1 hypothetical protein GKIL_2616 [Gloeobacter kilaueensis JS1]
MKRLLPALIFLVCGATRAWGAPLTQIESLDGNKEKEKIIRISAQGPLPFEVLEKSSSTLVLFLPRAELGYVSTQLSLSPFADIFLEQNPAGVRVQFQNLKLRFRVAAGQKPGTIDLTLVLPPDPPPNPAAASSLNSRQQPTSIQQRGLGGTPSNTNPTVGSPDNASVVTPDIASKPGSVSDDAEEDPDPPGPGVKPVPPRPTPPP